MPPNQIGPYRIMDTLGSGGAGTVYRAVDRRTGDYLALKLLATNPVLDPRAVRRLAREFETLADLSHPNVVRVFDTGVFQGYPYLAMELIEGLTLRHYLSLPEPPLSDAASLSPEPRRLSWGDSPEIHTGSARPFSLSHFNEEVPSEEFEFDAPAGPDSLRALADAADEPDTDRLSAGESRSGSVRELSKEGGEQPPLEAKSTVALGELNRPVRVGRLKDAMLQLCEALAYIHGHGLVHRDLKPSNVMVDEDRLVRLMDFGLAKFLAEDGVVVTVNKQLVGTFRYMAPEHILGETLDARTDLYSLGVILYELISGCPPFDAVTPYAVCQKILETEATPLKKLNPYADPQLIRVAHRLIRKESDQRYQTAEEVYEALNE